MNAKLLAAFVAAVLASPLAEVGAEAAPPPAEPAGAAPALPASAGIGAQTFTAAGATALLDACMKSELPQALQRLGVDPMIQTRDAAAAHAYALCRYVVEGCRAAADGEACRLVQARYGLLAGAPPPSRGAFLFAAAHVGDAARLRELLAAGAEVDWQNTAGWTPLMIAAAERHEGIVAALLAAGADVNHRNHYGRTALMYAAGYGLLPIIERLLAAGADPNLVPTDGEGGTALARAAARGHAAAVLALLQGGADPALRLRDGRSPADLAREGGHGEVLRLLAAGLVRPS